MVDHDWAIRGHARAPGDLLRCRPLRQQWRCRARLLVLPAGGPADRHQRLQPEPHRAQRQHWPARRHPGPGGLRFGRQSSEIQIFEWVGSGGSHGPLDELEFAASNGVTVCTADNVACAVTNNAATSSYWPYVPKFGHQRHVPGRELLRGRHRHHRTGRRRLLQHLPGQYPHLALRDRGPQGPGLGDFNTCGSIDLVEEDMPGSRWREPGVRRRDRTVPDQACADDPQRWPRRRHLRRAIRDDSVDDDNVCSIIAISGGTGNPAVGTGIAIAEQHHVHQGGRDAGGGHPEPDDGDTAVPVADQRVLEHRVDPCGPDRRRHQPHRRYAETGCRRDAALCCGFGTSVAGDQVVRGRDAWIRPTTSSRWSAPISRSPTPARRRKGWPSPSSSTRGWMEPPMT